MTGEAARVFFEDNSNVDSATPLEAEQANVALAQPHEDVIVTPAEFTDKELEWVMRLIHTKDQKADLQQFYDHKSRVSLLKQRAELEDFLDKAAIDPWTSRHIRVEEVEGRTNVWWESAPISEACPDVTPAPDTKDDILAQDQRQGSVYPDSIKDLLLPASELNIDDPYARRLNPAQLAVLRDFRGDPKIVVELLLRNPGVKVETRLLYGLIGGTSIASKRTGLSRSLRAARAHPRLGSYIRTVRVEYGRQKVWFGADDEPASVPDIEDTPAFSYIRKMLAADAAGKATVTTSIATPKPLVVRPVPPLVMATTAGYPTGIHPDTGRWLGRQPTLAFERALRAGTAHETPLSKTGLTIAEVKGEQHLMFGDRHIDVPLSVLSIMRLLAQHPERLRADALHAKVRKLVRGTVELQGLLSQLEFAERQLAGTGSLQKIHPEGMLPTYWIDGTLPSDMSKRPNVSGH